MAARKLIHEGAWGCKGRCLERRLHSYIVRCVIRWHVEIDPACEKIHLVCLAAEIVEKILIDAETGGTSYTPSDERQGALAAAHTAISLNDLKYWFGLRLSLYLIWIVDKVWIQCLKLVEFDKSTLVSESLLGKVFPTFISNEPLTLPTLLFLPVLENFFISLFPCQGPF